jgi:hypothetical protein
MTNNFTVAIVHSGEVGAEARTIVWPPAVWSRPWKVSSRKNLVGDYTICRSRFTTRLGRNLFLVP